MLTRLPAIFFFSFLIFFGNPLMAQVKFSNEFMTIGVGARAQGMSNALVANVNDVTAGYWNPAGLTGLEAPFQIGLMHAEWFAGIAQYDYIGLAKPINADKKSVIGLSLIRLGIDNIPNTLNLVGPDGSINYDEVTQFSAADYAFLVSYARAIRPNLTVGGNVKVIRRVIGSFASAWGFGIDLGIQYKKNKWQFGLMARDITSTFNAWSATLTDEEKTVFVSTGNDIPESSTEITRPRFILGAAYNTKIGKKLNLITELNIDITTDGQRNVLISSKAFNLDPHLGFELGYSNFIFLRGGVINFQKVKDEVDGTSDSWTVQPNFGVGLLFGGFSVDYAYTNFGNVAQQLYSNIFSIKFNLKSKKQS